MGKAMCVLVSSVLVEHITAMERVRAVYKRRKQQTREEIMKSESAEWRYKRTMSGMRENGRGYAKELQGIAWDIREGAPIDVAAELERLAENMDDDFTDPPAGMVMNSATIGKVYGNE